MNTILFRDENIVLSTIPAGTDYNDTTVTLTFDATISTQIVTVSILDDSVVEDTEFINLALTSVDSAVMLNPVTARINIEDVDSELTNGNCMQFHFSTVIINMSCAKVSVIFIIIMHCKNKVVVLAKY